MATSLTVPGVYVQEISTLPPSVAAVATAIPAFVGYTAQGPAVPTRITSFLEYQQTFGGPDNATIGITADASDAITAVSASVTFKLYYSIQAFYANGGGPCYIVSVGDYTATIGATALKDGIDLLESEDEPTLIVIPEATEIADSSVAASVYEEALAQCDKLKDRFTIIDFFPADISNFTTDVTTFRTDLSSPSLLYGATYFPSLVSVYNYGYLDTDVTITGGTYTGKTLTQVIAMTPAPGAFIASVRAAINGEFVTVNPSGYVAGVYAFVDSNRGVWKAPANVALTDVVAPTFKITDDNQSNLNVDPTSGKSINAIRTFTGKGTLIWGARTLDGNSSEWKYVNVRRLFIFVEESLQKATGAFVFEPNSAQTWTKVKGMIDNFLTGLWRQGALVGAKPSDAFYVNVGLGTTMTADDILNGIMNVEIGLAASRPAEFIVLKFSHKLQVS